MGPYIVLVTVLCIFILYTYASTLPITYISFNAGQQGGGAAADHRQEQKLNKYRNSVHQYRCDSIRPATLGPWGNGAKGFLRAGYEAHQNHRRLNSCHFCPPATQFDDPEEECMLYPSFPTGVWWEREAPQFQSNFHILMGGGDPRNRYYVTKHRRHDTKYCSTPLATKNKSSQIVTLSRLCAHALLKMETHS